MLGNNQKQGFTLIEMSIVIVIIGLIVGGILVGTTLVNSSEIRATISQSEKYNSAVSAFRTKYNCLPGDCLFATDFDFSTNGDGDGIIGVCSGKASCKYPADKSGENIVFWQHLNSASLIGDPIGLEGGEQGPAAKIAGIQSYYPGWGLVYEPKFDTLFGGGTIRGHALLLKSNFITVGLYGGYKPVDTYAIDQKIDDGMPASGSIRAFTKHTIDFMPGAQQGNFVFGSSIFVAHAHFATVLGVGAAGGDVCVRNDVTPIQYNINASLASLLSYCGLAIKSSF